MFDKQSLDKYITDTYGVLPEQPWLKYPTNTVYRHSSNKKWFAVVMTLPKTKLGLTDDSAVDVINLKCDSLMVGSLHKESGIYPGYHMNKSYWITVLLDGSVDDEKLRWLLDLSFDLTNKHIPEKKGKTKC